MKSNNSNNLIEYFAQIPLLWDIFEFFFGADKQKKTLYKTKVGISKKVMDFGCSSGNTTEAFIDYNYTGVDIDAQSIAHAQKKWIKYSNIKFIKTNILLPNKELGQFDDILFAGTGHHLTDRVLLKIFNKLDRYLKKNGEIHYFDTIKPSSSDPFLTRWICSIDRGGHIRSKNQTLNLIKKLTKKYKIIETSIEKVNNTIIPQPSYLYIRMKLVKDD